MSNKANKTEVVVATAEARNNNNNNQTPEAVVVTPEAKAAAEAITHKAGEAINKAEAKAKAQGVKILNKARVNTIALWGDAVEADWRTLPKAIKKLFITTRDLCEVGEPIAQKAREELAYILGVKPSEVTFSNAEQDRLKAYLRGGYKYLVTNTSGIANIARRIKVAEGIYKFEPLATFSARWVLKEALNMALTHPRSHTAEAGKYYTARYREVRKAEAERLAKAYEAEMARAKREAAVAKAEALLKEEALLEAEADGVVVA